MNIFLQLLVQAGFSYLATLTFGVILNIPRRNLNTCAWIGMIGWVSYWGLWQLGTGKLIANLVGAFLIGIISVIMGPIKKTPTLLFNIPALVPLVPGATAFEAVRYLVLGRLDMASSYLLTVLMVISAISVGFMIAQMLGELVKPVQLKYIAKKKQS
ncbi:threonine/serine exporter family protein [Agrilactobacillus yilanensis]|uniref:Threonine/serine exporter family protein n=1 Tax=Agrilactobacillus yilanensis TaxID=2485997 RepID=A0ABW4J4S8_9LACO|nr:threonine/serine exporter family protein [Agrilactobacillus yilanensis]